MSYEGTEEFRLEQNKIKEFPPQKEIEPYQDFTKQIINNITQFSAEQQVEILHTVLSKLKEDKRLKIEMVSEKLEDLKHDLQILNKLSS